MILLLIAVAVGVPILWTVSVGAVRDVRRARASDPRVGCQAWVAVPGLGRRRYRCCNPGYAGGSFCRLHEGESSRATLEPDPHARLIDEPQAAGRALAQARIGVPLAIVTTSAAGVLLVWAIQRVM